MIKKSSFGLIIILFLCFLSFLDLLYPAKGENVSRLAPQAGRAIFFLLMIFGIIHFYPKKGKVRNTNVGKSIAFFLIVVTSNFLFELENISVFLMDFVKIIYWMIGFFFISFLVLNNNLNSKHLEIFATVSIGIYFLVVLRDSVNEALMWGSRFYAVSNNGYNLLRLFPLALLIEKKSLKNILIGIIAVGVILSFKRGVILAFGLAYLIYYLMIMTNGKRRKFIDLFAGASIIFLATYYVLENFAVIEHRMRDFNSFESMGSGRGKMYYLILEEMLIYNTEIIRLLFGNGFYSTIDFYSEKIGHAIVAHSDLLELFFDFGIIGVVAFIYFFFALFNLFRYYKGTNQGRMLIIWMVVIFSSSMYSVNLFSPEMIYAIIPIAYLDAKRRLKNDEVLI